MNKWADEQVIFVKEDRHAIGHSHIEIQTRVLERRPEQSFFSQAEWHTSSKPALESQRQMNLYAQGQSELPSENLSPKQTTK